MSEPKMKLFVLDTNVLMHDPTALFRFQEHDIYLPMTVLEELDNNKKGHSEVARNARQASRFMDSLMAKAPSLEAISDGVPLGATEEDEEDTATSAISNAKFAAGRLFFQTEKVAINLPDTLPGGKSDNTILGTALALQQRHTDCKVILVSKDTNMRIKASVLGIHSEDYRNDQVLDDVDLLYRGVTELSEDFWDRHEKDMKSWQEEGRTFYSLKGPDISDWYRNEFIYTNDETHHLTLW